MLEIAVSLQDSAFIKKHAYVRYCASLFMKEEHRAAYQYLCLFAHELNSIPDKVKEPMAGDIRLQWWVEALSGARVEEVQAHPLARALTDIISHYALPLEPFLSMIEAVRFDLYQEAFESFNDFQAYAAQKEGAFLQLSARLLNDGQPVKSSDASGYGGLLICGTEILYKAHFCYQNHDAIASLLCYVPQELFDSDDHHLNAQEQLLRGMEGLVYYLESYMDFYKKAFKELEKELKSAFMPVQSSLYSVQKGSKLYKTGKGHMVLKKSLKPSPLRVLFKTLIPSL